MAHSGRCRCTAATLRHSLQWPSRLLPNASTARMPEPTSWSALSHKVLSAPCRPNANVARAAVMNS